MPLIKQIFEAIKSGILEQPFTVQDLKQWVKIKNIVKNDGEQYAEASINAMLSNSDKKNTPTSNKNTKVFKSKKNKEGKYEYWL